MANRLPFEKRLKKFRVDRGLKQPVMASIFDIGVEMYRKLERGTYVPKEESTMNRYLITLTELEKEKDLSKYLSGIHSSKASMRVDANKEQNDFLITENQTLKMDVASLKKQVSTLLTQIDYLYEQLKEKTAEIESHHRRRD